VAPTDCVRFQNTPKLNPEAMSCAKLLALSQLLWRDLLGAQDLFVRLGVRAYD
jgi:hypothetical protein